MSWEPPRCIHGRIILGCPHDDCPTQMTYLDQQQAAIREHHRRQEQAARSYVQSLFGLPSDVSDTIGRPDTWVG